MIKRILSLSLCLLLLCSPCIASDYTNEKPYRNMKTIAKPFGWAVGDEFPNIGKIIKFGHNAAIAASEEVVWETGGMYTYLTSEEQLYVSSGSGADDIGSTGALTVELQGLDGNYNPVTDTINMDGGTPVETNESFLRIFRVKVLTAGSGGTNAGVITIQNQVQDNTLATISAGLGQTLMAIWTVPAGKTARMVQLWGSDQTKNGVDIRLYARELGSVFQIKHSQEVADSAIIPFPLSLDFSEKTDIEVRGFGSASAGDVSGGFSAYYE